MTTPREGYADGADPREGYSPSEPPLAAVPSRLLTQPSPRPRVPDALRLAYPIDAPCQTHPIGGVGPTYPILDDALSLAYPIRADALTWNHPIATKGRSPIPPLSIRPPDPDLTPC